MIGKELGGKELKKPVFIAGNWKMNNSPKETEKFMESLNEIQLKNYGIGESVKVIVCPSPVSLERACRKRPPWLEIGAQDSYFEDSGAFTGETSPYMLKEMDVEYVIVGHSERRNIFGETEENINKKIKKMLDLGITPIVCIGENEIQREQNTTFPVIELQLKSALWGLAAEDIYKIIIAYEPVWAIGTGKAATPEDACEAGDFIRSIIADYQVDEELVPVLYGGSVSPENISSFLSKDSVDGALVGGKSVKAKSFIELIKQVSENNK